MKVPLAIVGCGGMGGRHLLGFQELANFSINNIDLVAVCDLRQDNAEYLAGEAHKQLGKRPRVFSDMVSMISDVNDLQGVIITTDARAHHTIVCQAFDLGLHVLCEKPLGLTIRGCNCILKAQDKSGKKLSVAENYRRDPMSRLTKALINAGLIGHPQLFVDASAGSGNRIIITPWRHKKLMGGMLLDGGVHNADMMLYFVGNVRQIFARIALWEKTRIHPQGAGSVSSFYEHWSAEMPSSIEATAEDTLTAVIDFTNGAIGQWTQSYAAHGRGYGNKVIFGSQGSIRPGGIRNGQSPVLSRDNEEDITGDNLLDLVPDFTLDNISSELFGNDRIASYHIPFPEVDRKLLAIEQYEFTDCILHDKTPEVDGVVGRQAVALCYGAFESSVLNRPVTPKEIETELTGVYESEINTDLGI